MALPMDEQRILEEMERMLAADDPRLAARLAAFGQPSVAQVLRTKRARAVLSLLALGVIACVAAVIYMVDAFHLSGTPSAPHSLRSSQPASSLSPSSAVPVTGKLHCVVFVTPRQCTAWASSVQPSAKPSARLSAQPAASPSSSSQAAKP